MGDRRTQLETVIQTAIDSAAKELHTSMPAVVVSFDPVTQLIDCQPTIKRKLAGKLVNLPLLVNVPIRFFKSSSFSITFPVEAGDHVLIIFAERSIDSWLIEGGIQNPFDIRKHSLSDAFALPMMYHQKDLIPDFNAIALEIKTNSGSTKIIVEEDKVQITNDLEVSGYIQGSEEADPADPPDDNYRIWQSIGSGLGNIGDIMIKITSEGVTRYGTMVDFSSLPIVP